jgi:hypothetical protein
MRILSLLLLLLASTVFALPSAAQEATPVVPGANLPPVATVTPEGDDPRLSICTAPTLDGFVPHVIRPGERLADLLTGAPQISVTQLAALNCLDDPAALPVGAVIWIPGPSASAPPAPAAEAEAETEDAAEPVIRLFRASALSAQNQSPITFSWEAEGAAAYFYACPGSLTSACERPLTAAAPLSGEITLSDFRYAGLKRFRLEVISGAETAAEEITVEITCSQESLGPVTGHAACPQEPPLSVFAAWQPFEGGVMLWFSDTEEIWVLTHIGQRVVVYVDDYMEGMPDPTADAPAGLFTPVRGFGRVWAALGGGDSILGWALAPETGFDSARQPAGSRSYTTFVQGPGDTVYAVTRIPQLEVGLWTQVAG